MALAPKARKITLDESLPPEEQLAHMARQLDAFMADVGNALDGGIDASNLRRQVKRIEVNTDGAGAPTVAVRFECTLPTRPSIVYPAQITVLSGSAPPAAIDTSHYTLVGGNVIEIQSIPGLAANSRYALTLFIE